MAPSPFGLQCEAGGFYIDPWRPVSCAVITHGHSDHARLGSDLYVCHRSTAPILRKRLGDVAIHAVEYGERLIKNSVTISLHPAGHVLGSAQARVEKDGDVWVASGDYKLEADGVCAPFEPLRCRVFITESTFALPIYRWRPQAEIFSDVNGWWRSNAERELASIIYAYSLGKAQRILAHLDPAIGEIYCHGAIEPMNAIHRDAGVRLPATRSVGEAAKKTFAGAMILAPPSAAGSAWLRRFGDYSDALASGWMQVRGNRRRRGLDRGFVLSDHADWPELLEAIAATGAQRVLATHGSSGPLTRYLRERGLDATALETRDGDGPMSEDAAATPDPP